ncbi:DUF2179 domain-containing protein [Thermoproteota archaeon]
MIFLNLDIYAWFLLPLLIFTARIIDVSLGTVRIILVSKGLKHFAPLFGFFEVLIWLLAIAQIMKDLTNIFLYIAYAGGFAMGTFVGIQLENRLSLGKVVVRIITRKEASELIQLLKTHHHGFTVADAEGPGGRVHIIYTIIDRHDLSEVVDDIRRFNPHAFYTIEDVRFASEEIFPIHKPWYEKLHPISFRSIRQRK